MKNASKSRAVLTLPLGAALVFLLAAIAPAATMAGDAPTGCEVVSLSFVQKTVHLPHSTLLRNHDNLEGTAGLEPSELPHAVHGECDVGLWRGKPPKGRAETFAKARTGQAAQVGVDTWAPNGESPDIGEWENNEFDKLTAGFLKGRFQVLKALPGKTRSLNPEGDGYIGAGILIKATGPAAGLEAAAGCWWDKGTSRVICLLDEEAEGKPVADDLNALAKKIVPSFLGAP
ncbi:MAG: hypothetical protein ACRDPE_17780 [Solirubrobacterales bacterium]